VPVSGTPIRQCEHNQEHRGDAVLLFSAWGNPTGPEDIHSDGIADVLDLLAVISA
jgi:hypothetical protein